MYCIYLPCPERRRRRVSLRTSLLNLELVATTTTATASPAAASSPAPPPAPAAAPAATIAARLFARSHDQIAAADIGAVELADQLLRVGRDLDLDEAVAARPAVVVHDDLGRRDRRDLGEERDDVVVAVACA